MTSLNRRAILAGAIAVPALSLPVIAAEPDPVFAAIEKARTTWERAGRVQAQNYNCNSDICVEVHEAWNAAHEDVFKTVPTTAAGASALIAFAFECARRSATSWEGEMGDYNVADENGEMVEGGNNVADLLTSLGTHLTSIA
jgi:hypothetical protein